MEREIKKNSLALLEEKSWYKEGLRFKCTGCGKCCQGPGYVWVNTQEIERLARHFKIKPSLFIKKFTRQIGERYALIDAPKSDHCIFLQNGRTCTVYKDRPDQCLSFPWWSSNVCSKKDWEGVKGYCEGIDHKEAPLFSLKEIQNNLGAED